MFYESVTYVITSVNDANNHKYQAFSQTLQLLLSPTTIAATTSFYARYRVEKMSRPHPSTRRRGRD